ncbi:MAG: NAD(P)/FAD-dependent oxidoreductase, partial [Pseudomonadales bacterium]
PLRVVVAGAGIVGASIAYHLARAGAAVTVIDQQGPATHASRGTFAWINATWAKQPRHYHGLNQQGVTDWLQLQSELALPVRWGGSLEWFASDARQQRLAEQIAEQVAWGEPASMVHAETLAQLEPELAVPPGLSAAYSPNDGAVDPVAATLKLLAAAQQLGAKVRFPVTLQNVTTAGGKLTGVQTTAGLLPADRLVLATGATELAERITGAALPQRSTPGAIAFTQPMPRLLNRVISAPGVHMHQRDDGRFVLGEQEGAPDNTAHQMRLQGRPNDFPNEEIARQHGNRMLEIARRWLPGLKAAVIDTAVIGWRPLPVDGHPVLGATPASPDVYVAIMHSGVSLAPVVGQLAAYELTAGAALEQLSPYRPTRDFETVRRY